MSEAEHAEEITGLLMAQFVRRSPRRFAQLLEQAEAGEVARVLSGLPRRDAATALTFTSPRAAAHALVQLSPEVAAALCVRLELPVLADLLRSLAEANREAQLERLPADLRRSVTRLLARPPDRVAAHLDADVTTVHAEQTAAQALAAVQQEGSASEVVFVVDDARALVGQLEWPRLLGAPTDALVSSLVSPAPHALAADARLDDAAGDPAWARTSTLPVVDSEGRLLGAVRHHMLLRARGELTPTTAPDPTQTAMELAELYAVGMGALWRWASSALPARKGAS